MKPGDDTELPGIAADSPNPCDPKRPFTPHSKTLRRHGDSTHARGSVLECGANRRFGSLLQVERNTTTLACSNCPLATLLFALFAVWLPLNAVSALTNAPATSLAETNAVQADEAPPARLRVSGYGLFGNREMRRLLRSLHSADEEPAHFDNAFVEDAALLLTARVKRDGYLRPTITVTLLLDDGGHMEFNADELINNPLPPSLRAVSVRFKIREGILYYYRTIDFEGLETISEQQALSFFIETDTLLRLKRNRVYTPERLRRGVASLRSVLERRGYQQVTVEASEADADDRTGAVSVTIRVQQGPQFLVRSIREEVVFDGTNEPPEIRTFETNRPYSQLWLQDFTVSLKTNLYHRGYPDVSVQIETVRTNDTGTNLLLDLNAKVASGPQVRIGEVKFEGQRRTRQRLLARRVRIKRGELLDPTLAEAGRFRLAELGIFDSVRLEYEPVDEHTRDVIYEVDEGKRLSVRLLAGYGSYELLRGGVEIEQNNIWGLAHSARLKFVQSFKSSSGQLTYTIPDSIGGDVDMFFHGSGLRREEVSFLREEYGGGFGLHKFFKEDATDLSLRYNYQILNALEAFPAVASEGLTNPAVGSVIADVKWDRRNNPLYPTRGYKIFATIETATEYLLGDANYERVEVSAAWHFPLGGGRYLSLGVAQGAAVSFGSPANNLPFTKRFFPGGANSIRGYQEGEASPRNADGEFVGAETYTLGTVQFEQALTPKWSVIVFSDSLGMARRLDNYPFDTGLYSVGAGIWWKTLLGPVRLEYGYNLNPRADDPTGTLQFSLGFPF